MPPEIVPQQPPWLRGPVPSISALLQPVAHSLIDADEDVRKVVAPLSQQEIAARPGGAASIAYHVTHAMGSLDRLLTYARGESLNEAQTSAHALERKFEVPPLSGRQLADAFSLAVARAHAQLRATQESDLFETRLVGRAKLPATTLALLFHAAEHTARHVGQIVTTAKIVVGS